ncbi:efflux RND transporter periplasmic adaptor subunit [Panacagrimonas sp.]|uniref:efflux RND transporter periplasmic adaptor subunit n=1 Tax=Panacagrimonas sp. TaxID=2480088 RepID=UPI003B523A6C
MEDKSALLRSLRIDRDATPEREPRRPWRWVTLAVVVALLGWMVYRLGPGAAVEISTVTARSEGGAPTAGSSVLDASGYVVARRQATVSSKITGKVVELLIEEGSRVEEGAVLARIDDSNIRTQLDLARAQADAARAQLGEVEVQLAEAERNLRRTRELATRQLLSESALDTAQANVDALRARLRSMRQNATVADRSVAVQAQQLDDTVVRAPFAGVVTVKNAQPGEMISPLSAGGDGTRTGIGTLVDMDSLEVEVDVNENFIKRVQAGQTAQTVLNAYPDWKIPSQVIAVIPTADRSKATVKVRIGLQVDDARVLPEMGARVSFLAPQQAQPASDEAARVLVAAAAIAREGDEDVVYIIAEGRAMRRTVERGEARGTDVEILAGLEGDEVLAASGLDALRDGRRVVVE